MTAEIVIANKSAVALAADSKVSIGGSRNIKTYDSVNKVFTLSKTLPVGIMIFGNAEFMNYPWETIIKLFRREHGSKDRDRIQNWSDDFVKYLDGFGIVDDHHRKENIKAIVGAWLYGVEEAAVQAAMSGGVSPPSPEYDSILLSVIKSHLATANSKGLWLSKNKASALFKKYGDIIYEVAKSIFPVEDGNPVLLASIELSVASLVGLIDSPHSSGFVIAGFGKKEFFPTVIEHNTDGFVGDHLKLRREEPTDITRSHAGYVGAFAQADIVQGFMNGFDSRLITKMTGGFSEVLEDSCFAVLEEHGIKSKKTDSVRNEIRSAVKERVETLIKDFVAESRERFSGPIVEMVSLLPKEELAHMAESLVALTSLRRRVSRDAETVGGPIDVALISKGDGFVWIKRKHYFRPELNPQFVRNYMTDVGKEDEE